MMSRRTFRAGKRYRGRFHFPRPNHPRQVPLSRMVRWYQYEPSALEVNFTDGSISRAEPSTLESVIVEGSISQALTIHAKCLYHGRFDGINMNLPRWRHVSRTVRDHRNVHRRLLSPVEISRFRRKCRFFCEKSAEKFAESKKVRIFAVRLRNNDG